LQIFLGFSDTGANFRDGGGDEADRLAGPWRCGIPGVVADSGAGPVTRWVTARARAVPVGFAARAPKGRERTSGVPKRGK
jgi:hypothetical protein